MNTNRWWDFQICISATLSLVPTYEINLFSYGQINLIDEIIIS